MTTAQPPEDRAELMKAIDKIANRMTSVELSENECTFDAAWVIANRDTLIFEARTARTRLTADPGPAAREAEREAVKRDELMDELALWTADTYHVPGDDENWSYHRHRFHVCADKLMEKYEIRALAQPKPAPDGGAV